MEQIIINIMRQLAEDMPDISLIDEDYGQLETDEDTYPVTFPCLLVGNLNIDWSDTKSGQRGVAIFTVRLACDCYHDTYIGSSQEDKVIERQTLARRVDNSLQGFCPSEHSGKIYRRKSAQFAIRGGIKVYETTFTFSLHD